MTKNQTRTRFDRAIRRRQLIDEAIRLIGQLGYHGFTVQTLAAACGLTNAGVLHYFGSKDSLLLAILDEIERREGEAIAPMLATIDREHDAGATLTVVRAMAQRIAGNVAQARFVAALQAESMDPAHPAHRWFAQREAETIALLTPLVAGADVKDAEARVRNLMALLYGYLLQWLRADRAFDLAAEVEQAAARALGGLG